MPKKSTKTTKTEAQKKASVPQEGRDNLGRFAPGNEIGGRYAAGIDENGEQNPKLRRTCKYEPRFAQMLIDYYNEPLYDEYRDSFGKIYRMARPVPSKIGFARRIGVWFDTVQNWAEMKNEDGTPRFPEFTAAWNLVEQYDKQNIADASLSGTHNGNFGKFLLSAKYGMKEQKAEESTVTVQIKTEDPNFDEESQ